MTTALLYPYTYSQRRPFFSWPVLFIPEYFTADENTHHQTFLSQEWQSVFDHPHIHIEYCSGNGQWILAQAKKYPHILWIAVELRYDRVRKIYKKLKAEKITNCLIAFGKAQTFTKYYLKSHSIQNIFVNFPDPWPKRKHAKYRICQQSFFEELDGALKPGAHITLASDDKTYVEQGIDEMFKSGLTALFPTPFYIPLEAEYGSSFFEDLWTKKGKLNYQTQFKKL
jgi:tRNA (guanine-N7-)-methyltransferase